MDILPDSRTKFAKGKRFHNNFWWVPLHCANCGIKCGEVPEDSTFAFYLCNNCFEKYGSVAGTYAIPDEIFFKQVSDLIKEEYDTYDINIEKELDNPDSPLSKLIKLSSG